MKATRSNGAFVAVGRRPLHLGADFPACHHKSLTSLKTAENESFERGDSAKALPRLPVLAFVQDFPFDRGPGESYIIQESTLTCT